MNIFRVCISVVKAIIICLLTLIVTPILVFVTLIAYGKLMSYCQLLTYNNKAPIEPLILICAIIMGCTVGIIGDFVSVCIFTESCKCGYTCIVKYMLNKRIRAVQPHLNICLIRACENNHEDIVDLLIKNGAVNLNICLRVVCSDTGSVAICAKLIEYGANDLNNSFILACINGHMNIIKLLLEKGEDDWDLGLIASSQNNHINIAKLMVEKGATVFDALNYDQKRELLNMGLNILLVCRDHEFRQIIYKRGYDLIPMALTIDNLMQESYDEIYDVNVLGLIFQYTNY